VLQLVYNNQRSEISERYVKADAAGVHDRFAASLWRACPFILSHVDRSRMLSHMASRLSSYCKNLGFWP
jgi:hypothetical protein